MRLPAVSQCPINQGQDLRIRRKANRVVEHNVRSCFSGCSLDAVWLVGQPMALSIFVGPRSFARRWNFVQDTPSNIDLLDDFYEEVSTLTERVTRESGPSGNAAAPVNPAQRSDNVEQQSSDAGAARKHHRQQRCVLNKRIYLIWKFPEYCTAYVVGHVLRIVTTLRQTDSRVSALSNSICMCTASSFCCGSYHQDTHVFPHFTIYNQCSGQSVFHFLPILLGM